MATCKLSSKTFETRRIKWSEIQLEAEKAQKLINYQTNHWPHLSSFAKSEVLSNCIDPLVFPNSTPLLQTHHQNQSQSLSLSLKIMPFPSSSITRKSEKRPFLRKCHSTTTPYQSHHQLHLQSRSISMPSCDPNLSSASPVSLSSTFFKRLLVSANWVFFYLVSKSFSFSSTDFSWLLLFFVSWEFCELNEILNWVCFDLFVGSSVLYVFHQ